jgi:hypothetical protein
MKEGTRGWVSVIPSAMQVVCWVPLCRFCIYKSFEFLFLRHWNHPLYILTHQRTKAPNSNFNQLPKWSSNLHLSPSFHSSTRSQLLSLLLRPPSAMLHQTLSSSELVAMTTTASVQQVFRLVNMYVIDDLHHLTFSGQEGTNSASLASAASVSRSWARMLLIILPTSFSKTCTPFVLSLAPESHRLTHKRVNGKSSGDSCCSYGVSSSCAAKWPSLNGKYVFTIRSFFNLFILIVCVSVLYNCKNTDKGYWRWQWVSAWKRARPRRRQGLGVYFRFLEGVAYLTVFTSLGDAFS